MRAIQYNIMKKTNSKTSEGYGKYQVTSSKYTALDNVLKMLEEEKRL